MSTKPKPSGFPRRSSVYAADAPAWFFSLDEHSAAVFLTAGGGYIKAITADMQTIAMPTVSDEKFAAFERSPFSSAV